MLSHRFVVMDEAGYWCRVDLTGTHFLGKHHPS